MSICRNLVVFITARGIALKKGFTKPFALVDMNESVSPHLSLSF
jgi:hypothetical protein